MLRMAWAEGQALASADHGASEPKRDCREAVSDGDMTHRIEIARAYDAGKIRIETVSVGSTNYLLQHDGHLLFFQTIRSRSHVSLGVLAEGRGVDELDCLQQLLQTKLDVLMGIGEHEGLVHARERLILRIFQQAGRTNGKRIMNAFEEREQVLEQGNRKRCQ